jgi:hypothetical protein
MQSHLGSVVLRLISTRMVGFKVLRNFYTNCGESVQPLQSVKLIDQPCSLSRVAWTLTWLMNLNMDLIWFPYIYVALLSTNHKCTYPCLCSYAVQRRTPEWSTSSTMRSSEACDQPVRCMWKMKMELYLHSYRCSCKDLCVYPRECNKS